MRHTPIRALRLQHVQTRGRSQETNSPRFMFHSTVWRRADLVRLTSAAVGFELPA